MTNEKITVGGLSREEVETICRFLHESLGMKIADPRITIEVDKDDYSDFGEGIVEAGNSTEAERGFY